MNQKEYAEYLGQLIDDSHIDLNRDLDEQFYAFFQCFMPNGENVEAVFEPLSNGEELYQRLLPIYEVTKEKTVSLLSEGKSPGYFCPTPSNNTEQLESLGIQFLKSLLDFSEIINEIELKELLENVVEVMVSKTDVSVVDQELSSYVYDVVGDWIIDNTDYDSLPAILSEAYYSINCDYFIAYYLQLSSTELMENGSFLIPYFEIWKSGYKCKLDKDRLIICL